MNKPSHETSKLMRDATAPVDLDASRREVDDDHQLVALAQQGDLKSYDELVTRHRGRIFAMIRNMIHQEADAWDLSQEVFIKAWSALPRFESRARFSTWLYRIAHNVVYDWTRKHKIESAGEWNDETFQSEQIDARSSTTPSASPSPDKSLKNSELRRQIEHALSKLSPEHQQVVVLKDVQGMAYKEIADIMDCSLGTVMSRLHYARQKLQIMLKDEYESR